MLHWEYTTVDRITAEDILPATLTAAQILMFIRRASSYINRRTGQYFVPIDEVKYLNGKNCPIVHSPDLIPIIYLDSMNVLADFCYDADDYDEDESIDITKVAISYLSDEMPRVIDVITFNLPWGVKNIEVDAVWGWVEDINHIETTTTTALGDTDTTVTVDDASKLQAGDVVYFIEAVDPFRTARVILDEVDYSTNELTFGAISLIGTTDLAIGTTVDRWGRVPVDIERLTFLIAKMLYDASPSGSTTPTPGILLREETDYYSIQFGTPSSHTTVLPLTIPDEAEDLIRTYTAPDYVGVV